jgi:septal ring factor EnvC (AmiA/AmiB activator)
MSLYGYADVLLKRPGDWVESGEPIANSGRSGGQAIDGVYFEIRKAGKPMDPGKWLRPHARQD